MKPKQCIEQLAAALQGPIEYNPDGDHRDFPLLAAQAIHELEKQGMIQTVNDKMFIHLQPENEVYRIGSAEPMTQDEFVEYTKGLKKPEKPSGFFSGLREWFHKYVHPLKDFAKYDRQMKQYEIKKYDLCKDAGLDVSGQDETIERYKTELAEETEKRLDDAAKKIQRNCGLADVDQLIGAFKKAVKADPEVGEHLMEKLPQQDLSTCMDLQWEMVSSKIEKYSEKGKFEFSVSDRDMHISRDLSLMQVCKRFLPPELQKKVDAKYAEAQEPYKKMNELMHGETLSAEDKSKLYKNWQSGEFEKTYWAEKNAPKVEEPTEKKPSEMSAEERVANAAQNRDHIDNAVVEETAEKLGAEKEMVQQAIETVNVENNVVANESEASAPDQPQMNV